MVEHRLDKALWKRNALEAEKGGTIPALALTGYASAEDAARAHMAGYRLTWPSQ